MKPYLREHLKSFAITFVATMSIEGFAALLSIYNGDFSKSTLMALGAAIIRAIIKTVLELIFPKVFPVVVTKKVLSASPADSKP